MLLEKAACFWTCSILTGGIEWSSLKRLKVLGLVVLYKTSRNRKDWSF